jgi:hypothetical protein
VTVSAWGRPLPVLRRSLPAVAVNKLPAQACCFPARQRTLPGSTRSGLSTLNWGNADSLGVALAQGGAKILDDCKSLKMKPAKNDIFWMACSDGSWMNYSELLMK